MHTMLARYSRSYQYYAYSSKHTYMYELVLSYIHTVYELLLLASSMMHTSYYPYYYYY